jgi:hypothetical protein
VVVGGFSDSGEPEELLGLIRHAPIANRELVERQHLDAERSRLGPQSLALALLSRWAEHGDASYASRRRISLHAGGLCRAWRPDPSLGQHRLGRRRFRASLPYTPGLSD